MPGNLGIQWLPQQFWVLIFLLQWGFSPLWDLCRTSFSATFPIQHYSLHILLQIWLFVDSSKFLWMRMVQRNSPVSAAVWVQSVDSLWSSKSDPERLYQDGFACAVSQNHEFKKLGFETSIKLDRTCVLVLYFWVSSIVKFFLPKDVIPIISVFYLTINCNFLCLAFNFL